ncbi:MAG: 4-hydroxythreonine-4-phosphate dehydrogenase PdxA, partial [Curvibacter sp.]
MTLGDAAGIGPEIILKAFRDAPEDLRGCFVVGDAAVLRRAAAWVGGSPASVLIQSPREAGALAPRAVPVLQ